MSSETTKNTSSEIKRTITQTLVLEMEYEGDRYDAFLEMNRKINTRLHGTGVKCVKSKTGDYMK